MSYEDDRLEELANMESDSQTIDDPSILAGDDNADVWDGATLNAYGQWIDRNGNYIQDATQDEIDAHPESEDPTLTGGGEGAEDPREPVKPPDMLEGAWNALKARYTKDGGVDWSKLMKDGSYLALAGKGIQTLLGGDKPAATSGYQGGVPDLVFNRAKVNYADSDRRPGSAQGLNFTGGVFSKPSDATGIMATLNQRAGEMAGSGPAIETRSAGSGYGPRGGVGGTASQNTFDANNATHTEAFKQAAEHMKHLIGQGNEQGARDFYNDKQTQFKFSDADFSPYLRQGGDPNANNFSTRQIAEWKANTTPPPPVKLAAGGITALAKGGSTKPRYLRGETDGMADQIKARIDGGQEARLAHGEFVIPADVVSHMGNGNSDAGAKKLYAMMDKIRMARTGSKKQGKQINPDKFMPSMGKKRMAEGGLTDDVPRFNGVTGSTVASPYGELAGGIQSLIMQGNEAGAKNLYNEKVNTFGDQFDKNAFAASTAGMGLGGANGFTVDQINQWAANPATSPVAAATGAPTSTGGTTTGVPSNTGLNSMNGGSDAQSPLASWAGPYVTNMLGKGQAIANDMTANPENYIYQGPRTAGVSALQTQAFDAAGGLKSNANIGKASDTAMGISGQMQGMKYTPGGEDYTGSNVGKYTNPYLQQSLNPQLEEAKRQAEIQRMTTAGRLVGSGAFGGGRQAIMESEGERNLQTQLAGITGKGYDEAFKNAQTQFNTQENRNQAERQFGAKYGIDALNASLGAAKTSADIGAQAGADTRANIGLQGNLGGTQRQIEQEGLTSDMNKFNEEAALPGQAVKFQQGLLSGLPISTSAAPQAQTSMISQLAALGLTAKQLSDLFGGGK